MLHGWSLPGQKQARRCFKPSIGQIQQDVINRLTYYDLISAGRLKRPVGDDAAGDSLITSISPVTESCRIIWGSMVDVERKR